MQLEFFCAQALLDPDFLCSPTSSQFPPALLLVEDEYSLSIHIVGGIAGITCFLLLFSLRKWSLLLTGFLQVLENLAKLSKLIMDFSRILKIFEIWVKWLWKALEKIWKVSHGILYELTLYPTLFQVIAVHFVSKYFSSVLFDSGLLIFR